ncbi:dihydroxy-acid dehydratase [Acuticoccus mangrovi]|uniref:Dihydroxy-acid dehydratase n=1 Tax=Acuticoccus mangrovi TaxID=2796142 RepID=A0A934MHP1_9HYPH|nr:dihydroxy-acid dehydratase [Acuticoccus mangrovi]MBJ3776291.1 dihydroxy-acid dehydratase [Acuticoccus mangrovi]
MMGRDARKDMDAYGFAPWIVGVFLAAGLIALMFEFAAPIS